MVQLLILIAKPAFMRLKYTICLYLTICITPFSLVGQSDLADHPINDQSLADLIKEASIPGMSIAVLNNNQLLYSQALGVKSAESNDSIDRATIFEAASLTKPLVAYCALKLVESGDLDLDTPLFHYLEYPDAADDDRYQQITARLVLSHATGLPNWRANRNGDKIKMKFDPGSKFGYSGEGFVYLQRVMEKMEGRNLQEIVSHYIFEPLEMSRSMLVFGNSTNYAVGHDKKSQPHKKFKPQQPNAAYSLHTTADDYLKFMQELVEPRNMDRRYMLMLQKHHRLMNQKEPSLGWGLGLGMNSLPGQTYYWHWGDNGVFRAFFILSVEQGTGFVYFTNSMNGLSIVDRMIELVFDNHQIMGEWKKYDQI